MIDDGRARLDGTTGEIDNPQGIDRSAIGRLEDMDRGRSVEKSPNEPNHSSSIYCANPEPREIIAHERMLASSSSIRDEDQISLVSSSSTTASTNGHHHHNHPHGNNGHHRLISSAAVFTGCLPSFGNNHDSSSIVDRRGRKQSDKTTSTFFCSGLETHATDGPHCSSSKIDELSPSLVCRTSTLPTSITEPQLSDFGSKVPMDFSHTTGSKIINDPHEVVAMLKEGHWRAKDQVRFHSPDNRLPHLSSYLIQPWFHGEMTRDEAVSLIGAQGNKDGTFLIRLSRSLPGCFVLSVSYGGSVLHYPITQVKDSSGDRLLSLDSGRTKFMDLLQLVEFYQVNSGNCLLPTTLRHFVTRAVDMPRYANPATPRCSF